MLSRKKIHNLFSKLFDYSLERGLFYISIFVILLIMAIFLPTYFILKDSNLNFLLDCSMKKIFHIPCPGCGGTRAIIYFFRGKILTALYYNAFTVYCLIMYIVFFVSQLLELLSKNRIRGIRFHDWYIYVSLIVLVVQYIFKLTFQINII